MRKVRSGILTTAIALLLATGYATAQTNTSDVSDRVIPSTDLAGEVYVGPHIGYLFIANDDFRCQCDVDQDDYIKYGGRLGAYLSNHFALEITGNYINLRPSFWELTLGGVYEAIRGERGEHCDACFTGEYPLADTDRATGKFALEELSPLPQVTNANGNGSGAHEPVAAIAPITS